MAAHGSGVRSAVNLSALKLRIRATKNVAKIVRTGRPPLLLAAPAPASTLWPASAADGPRAMLGEPRGARVWARGAGKRAGERRTPVPPHRSPHPRFFPLSTRYPNAPRPSPPSSPSLSCPRPSLLTPTPLIRAAQTNVMKLVASSKLRSVEEQLQRGRAFGESILNAIAVSAEDQAKAAAAAAAAAGGAAPKRDEDGAKGIFLDDRKHLCVLVTTDRGLCGAVNSSLSRSLRKELNAALKEKRSVRLLTLGDKGRAQIARDYAPIVARAIDNCFDKDPIFPLAAALAAKIVSEPYEVLTLYYNHYENQAKFHNSYKQIPQLVGAKGKAAVGKLAAYDVEPEVDETMLNLQEYGIASALYYAMLETAACETSQRVMAMDNATTNAKDMVHNLSLTFNRARQAKITTELTEIISGSESLNTGVVDY